MGWHRNHAISHSPNQIFFEDTFVSHPVGPNEQFGTHEKLSWGVQGNLNWMAGYGSCPMGGTLEHWGCLGGQKIIFFKHGHVAYKIAGDDKQNRMLVNFHPRVKLVTLG